MIKIEPPPNPDVFNHAVGLFTLWAEDGYRKNIYYERLCEIAEILELPTGSEEHKILMTVKAPNDDQIQLVATTLAKRAINLHWEVGW